jgi:hypothetical protein
MTTARWATRKAMKTWKRRWAKEKDDDARALGEG